MTKKRPYRIKVEGEYAMFSRPGTKAEPLSYPIMTPTAAIGLLEAIYWKPEFDWIIKSIEMLRYVQYTNFARNYIKEKQKVGKNIIAKQVRVQSHQAVLKNVGYVIECDIKLRDRITDSIGKYCEQFERRMDIGACFQQPFLGIREFIADFSWAEAEDNAHSDYRQCGLMPLKINYIQDANGKIVWRDRITREYVRGRAETEWFEAEIKDGKLVEKGKECLKSYSS